MSTTLITYGNTDITANVMFGPTTFTAKVNGQIGDALVSVRDIDHTFVPVSGQRLVCEIDGDVKWTGFGVRITKSYMFPAQDTTDLAAVVGVWVIEGVDDNILFDRRVVFDAADPSGHIDFNYDPGSWDDDIIIDIFDNYLDLSGDNITREGVQRVGVAIRDIPGITSIRGHTDKLADNEGIANTGTVAKAGYKWLQTMNLIQHATGAIYYIDGVSNPDHRILRYVDVETATSDYTLTDTPSGGLDVRYSDFALVENATNMANDMHVWGEALGANLTVHARSEDDDSIDLHGRWQDGLYSDSLYRLQSAEIVADSYVYGTPSNHRGRKDDQVTFSCRTLSPLFAVGLVVPVVNSVFDISDVFPLREMRITFFSPDMPIFDLVLGNEIDQPWAISEYLRLTPRPFEIKRFHWAFPVPLRLPFCPVPSGLLLSGRDMLATYERDFGGSSVDEAPLWQNPPFGGGHLNPGDGAARTLVETIPKTGPGFGHGDPFGYISDRTIIQLKAPTSGAIELLIALDLSEEVKLGGSGTFHLFSNDPGAGTNSNALNCILEWGPSEDGVNVFVQSFFAWYEAAADTVRHQGMDNWAPLSSRVLREPCWMRVLIDPLQGRYVRVWPRRLREPAAWTISVPNTDLSDIEFDPPNKVLGTWFPVIDQVWVIFDGDPLGDHRMVKAGLEAVSIYSEHSSNDPAYWDIYGFGSDAYAAYGSYSPIDAPGPWTPDFGGSIDALGIGFYFWGPEPGSFSQNRYFSPSDDLTSTSDWPQHRLHFSWPHFFFGTWDNSLLYLTQAEQYIVSVDLRDESFTATSLAAIGFVENLPASVTISGEVHIADESGGLYENASQDGTIPGLPNLPFPALLSFNWYGFGSGDPFWTTPYEALPVRRNYVNYNAVGETEPHWEPFEFTIPVDGGAYEAGDLFQWGVSFVGDMISFFRAGLPNRPPPGRGFLTANQATVGVTFRKLQYKATYVTDSVGAYFCLPEDMVMEGSAIGQPAFDSGDELTYLTGSAFIAGSTTVWVNGLIQVYGADEQYTEDPAAGKIIFNSPLNPDDEVIVDLVATGPPWGLP